MKWSAAVATAAAVRRAKEMEMVGYGCARTWKNCADQTAPIPEMYQTPSQASQVSQAEGFSVLTYETQLYSIGILRVFYLLPLMAWLWLSKLHNTHT